MVPVSIYTSGHALPDGIDPFVKNVGNWTDRINLLAEDFFLLMINNLIDVFAIHGVLHRHRGGRTGNINAWYLSTHMVYL
jgi:hypothetical protein